MDKIITAHQPQALAFAASYVAVLILLGLVLTFRVVFLRRDARVSLGDGGNDELRKRVRAHGNFAEHAPWIAAALILLPLLGAREWMVHLVGLSGVTGRIVHALAVSQGDHRLKFRVLGMVLTTLSLTAGLVLLLVRAWTL